MLPVKRETTSARKSAFARALERFRKSQAVEPSNATSFLDWAAEFPKPAPEPDEFYFVMRCAVNGRYSRALYKRAPNGMFIPQSKLTKVERGRADAGGMAAGLPPRIEAHRINLIDEPCPWCAGKLVYSHVHCGRCQKILCTGRSYLEFGTVVFVCHEDCGEHAPVNKSFITSYAVEPRTAPGQAAPREPRQSLEGARRTVVTVETTVLLVRRRKL
jgi:hypothetical protein